jgi:hypothetical protein
VRIAYPLASRKIFNTFTISCDTVHRSIGDAFSSADLPALPGDVDNAFLTFVQIALQQSGVSLANSNAF